jgi:hypothetical protein
MEQLSKVIQADLRSSKNRSNRLLGVGIVFAMLAHFYVVEPYFAYKAQERSAARTLASAEKKLKELSEQVAGIEQVNKQADSALNEMLARIERYPDHLRQMLPRIDEALLTREASENMQRREAPATEQARQSGFTVEGQQQGLSRRINGVELPPHITEFEDAVRWYIEHWFKDLLSDLENRVVRPILKLKQGEQRAEIPDLEAMAQGAMSNLNQYLDSVDPQFWRSYRDGKVPVSMGLQQVVKDSFEPLEGEVDKLLVKTKKVVTEKTEELTTVRKHLADIGLKRGALEARINSLESPLGRIPLSLPDLIVLFPLLMTIVFVMVAVALYKTSQLYVVLWRQFRNNGSERNVADFHYYADCWFLPPYRNVGQPLLLVVWTILVAGIAIRGSVLVMGEDELFTSLTGEVFYYKLSFFLCGYILGSLLIVGFLIFLYRALKRISHELSPYLP